MSRSEMNANADGTIESKGDFTEPLLRSNEHTEEDEYRWSSKHPSHSARVLDKIRRSLRDQSVSRMGFPILYILFGMLIGCTLVATNTGLISTKMAPMVTNTPTAATQSDVANSTRMDYDQLAPAKKGAKIGTCSLFWGTGRRMNFQDGFKPEDGPRLFAESLKLTEKYAKKWGYPFWLGRDPFLEGPQDGGRTGMWTKEAFVLSILLDEIRKPADTRLEWIYYIDSDAILLNHNIPLETFLPPDTEFGRNISLMAATDQWSTLDAGAFLVRVSQDGIRLLTTLLAYPFVKDSEGVRFNQGEQSAMASLMKNEKLQDAIAKVPDFWFNADVLGTYYPEMFHRKSYHLGDFAIHFMSHRKAGWPEILEQAMMGTNKTLSPALEDTRLMKGDETVAQFWKHWESIGYEERTKIKNQASKGQD